MAKYISTKEIEAVPFIVPEEQKKAIDSGDPVISPEGVQIKKAPDGYFGLIPIGGYSHTIQEGDYIIKESGRASQIVGKASFEASHAPVETTQS